MTPLAFRMVWERLLYLSCTDPRDFQLHQTPVGILLKCCSTLCDEYADEPPPHGLGARSLHNILLRLLRRIPNFVHTQSCQAAVARLRSSLANEDPANWSFCWDSLWEAL